MRRWRYKDRQYHYGAVCCFPIDRGLSLTQFATGKMVQHLSENSSEGLLSMQKSGGALKEPCGLFPSFSMQQVNGWGTSEPLIISIKALVWYSSLLITWIVLRETVNDLLLRRQYLLWALLCLLKVSPVLTTFLHHESKQFSLTWFGHRALIRSFMEGGAQN